MLRKRKFAALVLGAGLGLTGCQTGGLGKLASWNKSDSAASTSPDLAQHTESGLSQQLASDSLRPAGQPRAGTAPLGGQKPAESSNFLTASWKKTTAAVGGAFKSKPTDAEPDPLSLEHQPDHVNADVFVAAARLLENQNKFDEAEQQYQKALQAEPNHLGALVGLARMHDRQGHAQQSLQHYERALAAHPRDGLVQNDLGLYYARQRQFDKSLQALRKAVELKPDNAKYRNNLATVLVEAGRTQEAIQQLSATTGPAAAHYNVGYLLQQKGQTAEAQRLLEQALALDPALAPAQELLARISGTGLPGPASPPPTAPPPAAAAAPPPAMHVAAQPRPEVVRPYAASASEHADYYAGSQPVPTQTAALPHSPGASYHVGDDGPLGAAAPPTQTNGYTLQQLPAID